MSYEIGERVAAISHTQDNTVYLYGFGVYEGDYIPPKEVGGFNISGMPNPRIRLDNGKVVYGCECWWGDESRVKEEIKNMEIIYIEGYEST